MQTIASGKRTRRHDRRGVSPIIATILLVAIVVVLAAVMYVVVEGTFNHNGPTAPLGTSLSLGPAVESVGTKTTNAYCQTGHACYAVSVAYVSGVSLGQLEFAVKTGTGTTWTTSSGTAGMYIVLDKTVVLKETFKNHAPLATSTWTSVAKGYSTSTPLSSAMTIWVQFGTKMKDPVGQGFVLEANGINGFSGTVATSLP